jgi:hypothetical protein
VALKHERYISLLKKVLPAMVCLFLALPRTF